VLLDTFAEYTLRPAEANVSEVELRGRELEMKEREFRLRELSGNSSSKTTA